jgi:hypothetical protein
MSKQLLTHTPRFSRGLVSRPAITTSPKLLGYHGFSTQLCPRPSLPSTNPSNMAKSKPQQTTYSTLANYHATQKHHGEILRDHTSTLHELRLHKARMDATLHEHKARTDAKLHSLEAHRDTLQSLERKRITNISNVRSEVHWAKMQAIMVVTVVVVLEMTAWKMLAAEVEALRREVRARRG